MQELRYSNLDIKEVDYNCFKDKSDLQLKKYLGNIKYLGI